jgi:hypothetical protein
LDARRADLVSAVLLSCRIRYNPAMAKPPVAKRIKTTADLTADPRNARKHGERNLTTIQASLQSFGAARSIVVDEDGVILAGNGLVEAAGKAGIVKVRTVETDGQEIVAVVRRGLTKEQKLGLAVADNRAGELAEWDSEILEGLGDEIDLSAYFTTDELAALYAAGPKELKTDEDAVPPVPAEPVSKLGDLWILGDHRLLCGDSTKRGDVERLMGGEKVGMAYNDPPYGISVVNSRGQVEDRLTPGPALRRGTVGASKPFGSKSAGGPGTTRKGEMKRAIIEANVYPEIIGDDSTATALTAYELCASLKIETLIFWGGNYYADGLPASSCWIVWDKDNGDSFFADAELAWTNHKTAVRIFKHQWNGLIKASERGQKRVHPTQKPVALAEWCFQQYGSENDGVLDLFGGSGSTLIACEKTHRKSYLMELSPAYCDVIIERWQNATGSFAMREDGISWDQLKAARVPQPVLASLSEPSEF